MQKLIIVFFALLLMPSYALFAAEKPPATNEQCAIQNSYIAEYLDHFERIDLTSVYVGVGIGPARRVDKKDGIWFESKVVRGEKPCEFIYTYRVKNTSDEPLMVFFEVPWRFIEYIVPRLIYLPIDGAEEFGFHWEGQPNAKRASVTVFSHMRRHSFYEKVEGIILPTAREHLWIKEYGGSGEVTVFAPAQWFR